MGQCLSRSKSRVSPSLLVSNSQRNSVGNRSATGGHKPPRRTASGKRIAAGGNEALLLLGPGALQAELLPPSFELSVPARLRQSGPVGADFALNPRHPLALSSPFQVCTNVATGSQHVYRRLPKDGRDGRDVQTEVCIMHNLSPHRHVLGMHGVYEDEDGYSVIYDECPTTTDMFDYVLSSHEHGLSEPEAAFVFRQVLEAVAHLQSNMILHRDLSLENLLVYHRGGSSTQVQLNSTPNSRADASPPVKRGGGIPHVLLTSLGNATKFKDGQTFDGVVGNSYYVAPEVIQGKHGREAESWSCGVLLYILLCGYPPFPGDDELEVFTAVLSTSPDFSDEVWASKSKDAVNVVRACLQRDPKARPTIQQLLNHRWVRERAGAAFVAQEAVAGAGGTGTGQDNAPAA